MGSMIGGGLSSNPLFAEAAIQELAYRRHPRRLISSFQR
jgi:hypothetical protein